MKPTQLLISDMEDLHLYRRICRDAPDRDWRFELIANSKELRDEALAYEKGTGLSWNLSVSHYVWNEGPVLPK